VAPSVVFWTETVALGTGCPLVSVTRPVTRRCAAAWLPTTAVNPNANASVTSLLMTRARALLGRARSGIEPREGWVFLPSRRIVRMPVTTSVRVGKHPRIARETLGTFAIVAERSTTLVRRRRAHQCRTAALVRGKTERCQLAC